MARESLLPKIFEIGEKVVEKSLVLFGGMIGPFCLETIITDQLEFIVFEISSPYSDLISDNLSTGRRIAKEIKLAQEEDKLEEIIT